MSSEPPKPPGDYNRSKIDQLFLQAKIELEKLPHTLIEEEVLFPTEEDVEKIIDLFEKSRLSLSSAEQNIEQSGADNPEARVLGSSALAKALGGVEKITGTQIAALQSARDQSAQVSAARLKLKVPQRRLTTATTHERLEAAFIDAITMIPVALVLNALILLFRGNGLFSTYEMLVSGDLFEILPLAALFGCTYLITLVLYPCFALLIKKKTRGLSFKRLRLVCEDGSTPQAEHILVRSLLLPISLLCGGILVMFIGKRAIHDKFSRTTISRY